MPTNGRALVSSVPLFFLIGSTAFATPQQELWHLDGGEDGDLFGDSMVTTSDRDGDGVVDLLVGAPGGRCGSTHPWGAVHLFSSVDALDLLSACGPIENEGFGSVLAETDDLDGDGIRDFMIGLPSHADPDHGEHGGAVDLVSGADFSLILELIGQGFNGGFGASCAAIDDVDGDGVGDLLIGEPNFSFRGLAYVYSGASGALLRTHDLFEDGHNFGEGAARLGDVDADGVADYAIQDLASDAYVSGGAVYVHSGASGELLFKWKGSHSGGSFGQSITDAGDLNGDGYDDVFVGAPDGTVSGFVHAFSGKNGRLLFKLRGDLNRDWFGHSCARVGDMNGDGFEEILVGAHVDKHDGKNAGAAFLFSGKNQRLLYRFYPGYFQGLLGDRVAGGFDIDGDSIPDVAISALNAPPDEDGNYHGGRVTAYAGNDLFLQSDRIDAKPGDTVNVATRGGSEGALALLVVTDVSGVPTFVTLACSALDANGESTFTADVPAEASGNTYTLLAYAQKPGGRGLIDSWFETISVE